VVSRGRPNARLEAAVRDGLQDLLGELGSQIRAGQLAEGIGVALELPEQLAGIGRAMQQAQGHFSAARAQLAIDITSQKLNITVGKHCPITRNLPG
jgi:hypothetical protein